MLKKLKVTDFCCHKSFEAEFKPGINCIVGGNGQGKSTLLSALYGALTNSYDHPDGTRGVIRQGAESAKIEAQFDDFIIILYASD